MPLLKHLFNSKARKILFFSLILVLFLPIICSASQVKSDNSIFVGPRDTIEGNLYAIGSRITIAGQIKGDLIFVGQNVDISGSVAGDVIGLSKKAKITGPVAGSVRLLVSDQAIIASSVKHNLMVGFGRQLIIASSSIIGWDAIIAGETALVRGQVVNNLSAYLSQAIISGQIGQNVNIHLAAAVNKPHLFIEPSAVIGGQLKYTDYIKGQISPQAKIKGQVVFAPLSEQNQPLFSVYQLLKEIYLIFSAFVVGLVMVSLWRQPIIDITDLMLAQVSASLSRGVGLMFISPFVFVFLVLTLIGLPLAIILFIFWLIFIYLSKIITGILLGRSLIEKFWPSKEYSLVWAMIIGILVLWPLFFLPFLGWLFALIVSWWGLGGFYLYFKKNRQVF